MSASCHHSAPKGRSPRSVWHSAARSRSCWSERCRPSTDSSDEWVAEARAIAPSVEGRFPE